MSGYEYALLDPANALGVELRRPVPKGDAFLDWVGENEGLVEFVDALLKHGYDWDAVAAALCDLTRWRWCPTTENLQSFYLLQGGSEANVTGQVAV